MSNPGRLTTGELNTTIKALDWLGTNEQARTLLDTETSKRLGTLLAACRREFENRTLAERAARRNAVAERLARSGHEG